MIAKYFIPTNFFSIDFLWFWQIMKKRKKINVTAPKIKLTNSEFDVPKM